MSAQLSSQGSLQLCCLEQRVSRMLEEYEKKSLSSLRNSELNKVIKLVFLPGDV